MDEFTVPSQQIEATGSCFKLEAGLRALIAVSPLPMLLLESDGRILLGNAGFLDLCGYSLTEIQQEDGWWKTVLPNSEQRMTMLEGVGPPVSTDQPDPDHSELWPLVIDLMARDGSVLHLDVHAIPCGDATLVTFHDLTERLKVQRRLERTAAVFDNTTQGVFITDADGCILAVNQAFTHITGYSEEEVLGLNPSILSSGRQDKAFYQRFWKALEEHGHWEGEIWNRTKNDGLFAEHLSVSEVRDEHGCLQSYTAVFADITAAKRTEARLDFLAHHDPLTRLPNRGLFEVELHRAVVRASRSGAMMAVLFVDLDHFKSVNDRLGHAAGDAVLVETARRLRRVVRRSDSIARLGGDEFTLLLEQAGSRVVVSRVAQKLIDALLRPFSIGGREVCVSASIGISLLPGDGEDGESLVQHADAAMYQAKALGGNSFQFFTRAMTAAAYERLTFESDLQESLRREELQILYQPQVALEGDRIVGCEALLRWHHPKLGVVMPDRFIPVADETGFINTLGGWLLPQACQDAKQWLVDGLLEFVSINVTGVQMRTGDFLAMVAHALSTTGIAPGQLEIEITEGFFMGELDDVANILRGLEAMGVRLCIDDVGTAFLSLAQLQRLSVQQLKIDESLIWQADKEGGDNGVLRAAVALGHSFGMTVVAEGVETQDQYQCVKEGGCDRLQGFWLSEPLSVEAFGRYLHGTQGVSAIAPASDSPR